jgi:hypothetical protein
VSVVQQSDSLIEILANHMALQPGEKHSTVLAEVGTWKTETGNKSGVLVDVVGDLAALLSATDARKLGRWLMRAAEELDGKPAQDRKNRPRRRYEDDED